MDQRLQLPHGYSRPQDRPLIQNPNHQPMSQPPPSQPHPGLYHPPSSQQPPFQIPPSDPFQHRAPDPFLPNPQSQRRGSYGLSSGRDAVSGSNGDRPSVAAAAWPSTSASNSTPSSAHPHSAPPPPLPLSTTLGGGVSAAYAYDAARRRSLGGQSPPRYYNSASSNDPPLPPGPFSNRQMPPPSPSQQPPQAAAYPGQRGPPPPPPFSAGRELPGLGSTPRPGAGMSISSLLGDAPSSQPPARQHHSSPTGNSQSPTPSIQPPSPHRGQSISSKLNYTWRRPQTPDKHHVPSALRAPENAPYSANSSPAHFAPARRSPEFARSGPPLLQQLYQSTAGQGPHTYQLSPASGQERDHSRHGEEHVPPRPNSQPAGLAVPLSSETGPKDGMSSFAPRPPFATYSPHDRREEHRTPATSSYSNEPILASRDRPITVEPLGPSAYSSPNNQRDMLGRERAREELVRDTLLRRDDFTGPFRSGFRTQYHPLLGTTPGPEAPRSHPQNLDPFRRPLEGQSIFGADYKAYDRPVNQSLDPLPQDRRTSEPQSHPGDIQYRGLLHDHQPLAMQRSRSSLGIGPEGKRGRASPLPQAVQGAQAQPIAIGSDPGIKSEFGRIFQGLGSGLGAHIPGSSTPSRQSPMPQRIAPTDVEPIVLSDGDASKITGAEPKLSKKNRRVKEEDSRLDNESPDGRGTPLGSGVRGSKRAKVSHHHHLHQRTHPHHHHIHGHVHRPEDDISRNPFSAPLPASTPTVHHHHHIHTSHHHHHTPLAPRTQVQTPIIPIRKPITTINSRAVLDLVIDRPRKHLGSELYEPEITLPPFAMSSHTDDKFGYFTRYKPSRTFEEKDLNCTFTIRIARDYLTRETRESICKDRNLHGTEVYTDDSDPIAILIHTGWLRGEWPADVDTEMMDLPAAQDEGAEVDEEVTSKPRIPIVPPEEMDAHITVLILPKLKAYKGCVRYGMESREWGDNHDGNSWMVQKLRWVDEGRSRGNKRTGKARRERLDVLREEAAMALVGLSEMNGTAGVSKRLERLPLAQVAA